MSTDEVSDSIFAIHREIVCAALDSVHIIAETPLWLTEGIANDLALDMLEAPVILSVLAEGHGEAFLESAELDIVQTVANVARSLAHM